MVNEVGDMSWYTSHFPSSLLILYLQEVAHQILNLHISLYHIFIPVRIKRK